MIKNIPSFLKELSCTFSKHWNFKQGTNQESKSQGDQGRAGQGQGRSGSGQKEGGRREEGQGRGGEEGEGRGEEEQGSRQEADQEGQAEAWKFLQGQNLNVFFYQTMSFLIVIKKLNLNCYVNPEFNT